MGVAAAGPSDTGARAPEGSIGSAGPRDPDPDAASSSPGIAEVPSSVATRGPSPATDDADPVEPDVPTLASDAAAHDVL